MFYSTKLMNFWHKNLHFVHNPSKLFKKGAAPPPNTIPYNNIATSTRIPMITRTTSSSVNEKALNAFPLKVFRFRTFIIHTLYS